MSELWLVWLAALGAGLLLAGCGRGAVDQALDSDANGYQCGQCRARFYTDRDVFADFCPACRSAEIQPVVGFVCADDKHVTIAPRGRGFLKCEQCGKTTSSLCIPRQRDLQAWGAAHKSRKEVCGR